MIYYTEAAFDKLDTNPFGGVSYDESWILLRLTDQGDFYLTTGNGGHRLFQFVLNKKSPHWQYHFMDFIEYESRLGKNIIVAAHKDDIEEAEKVYSGHNIGDKYLRKYEKPFLVHSTDAESYKKIVKCGCLKSWNLLKSENSIGESEPIGKLLGDPEDYSDYIMFSDGGYFNELVVMSKQKGEISSDVNAEYRAGARMYFSAERIAADGLLLRDGAHLKVRRTLALKKYLVWTATPKILGISEITTPREFGEKADNCFFEFIKRT